MIDYHARTLHHSIDFNLDCHQSTGYCVCLYNNLTVSTNGKQSWSALHGQFSLESFQIMFIFLVQLRPLVKKWH